MLHLRGRDTVWISKVKGHADECVVLDGRVREVDRLVIALLMRLLTMVVEGLVMLSSKLVVICLGFVVAGTLLSLTFIGFSLPILVQLSIMMVVRVQLLIL